MNKQLYVKKVKIITTNKLFKDKIHYSSVKKVGRDGENMIECIIKLIVFGLSGFFGISSVLGSILDDVIIATIGGICGAVTAIILVKIIEKRPKRIAS